MARYHIILGNGEGCGESSSHETKESADTRAALLNAHGRGPCKVWEEAPAEADTSAEDGLTAADYIAMYG